MNLIMYTDMSLLFKATKHASLASLVAEYEAPTTDLGLSWPVLERTSVHSSMLSAPSLFVSASLKASSWDWRYSIVVDRFISQSSSGRTFNTFTGKVGVVRSTGSTHC